MTRLVSTPAPAGTRRPRGVEVPGVKVCLGRALPLIGKLRVQEVTPDALRSMIRKLEGKYAPRTAVTTLTPVRKCLARAARDGLIGFSPFSQLGGARTCRRSASVLSES